MAQVLVIWLPNWPLQRILASEPLLADRAVVLETRDPRRGLLIAAANYLARKNGARVGMRLSELAAIKTPDDFRWEIRTYQPHLDLDTLCDWPSKPSNSAPWLAWNRWMPSHGTVARRTNRKAWCWSQLALRICLADRTNTWLLSANG